MRFRQIEVFHAVYTHGSISAAARALGVSQPSVSKTLRHAEDSLGFPLFQLARGRLGRLVGLHVAHRQRGQLAQHVPRALGQRRSDRGVRHDDDADHDGALGGWPATACSSAWAKRPATS